MQEEVEITIRQAVPSDAPELLKISKILSEETDFLVMDEVGMNLPADELAGHLAALYESDENILLVALADSKMIGLASVSASKSTVENSFGELGISLLKEYWGFGLGGLMMEEILYWAHESRLSRLKLRVQQRNLRAIHLYEKFDFQIDEKIKNGAKTKENYLIDILAMSLPIK